MIHPGENAERAKRTLLASNARRLVLIALNEWKSDSMVTTSLRYDVSLEVMDERGNPLASNTIKGTDNLGAQLISQESSIMSSFVAKFDALFGDEKIVAALK